MATAKPRITITLDKRDYDVLKRLSRLNKSPMSRTVKELVELVTPVLSRMADSIESVALADENIKRGLRNSLESNLEAVEGAYKVAIENFDMFADELNAAAMAAAGAECASVAGASAAAAAPPPSNTGVRSVNFKAKGGRIQ